MSWRCRLGELAALQWLWPLVGHLIRINGGWAYCERRGCYWAEALPEFDI